ncbi:bifunctional nicotinamide-nucleotide adenylyltransferase/Nudix hydroxylase [Comamonas composti]|uniref:bifunctional nicotinamide-nucleotide adenylyltransferase/Nudix hydroxylase n=1 Tax=Comamonas composti TaxID=408558 RepID=UPI00042418B9|nr:bifunctional nicotinamide-nucleotide adenylyltransferase/Nudix hydroxylase [Comamonas composti]
MPEISTSASTVRTVDTAVLIGRFQPLHNGHMALLREALARARQVVVVLGSAWQAANPKNPFSWQQRAQMLSAALPEADAARVHCTPVRDYYNEPLWVQAVRQAVQAHVAAGASVALVGHFKDASSSYLARFPGWQLISLPRLGAFDATPLREKYLGATTQTQMEQALAELAPDLPPSTLDFLRGFAQTPMYARLHKEAAMLAGYKKAWAAAPYPPVFVTVDALLTCSLQSRPHVLLIRRAHAPGEGLWALPGGFLEPRDSLWQSCLRELHEETCASLEEHELLTGLQSVQVFDHPDRSLRGRTITHVHHIDLGERSSLPPVQGGDDAAQACWVALAGLQKLEEQFFEDHFQILSQMLPPSGTPSVQAPEPAQTLLKQ